ncbi:hypothetical protein [Paraburkholderia dilworthii]|uniref:hypothetical protein n=1 Tax=Paraburkholderia dilworthii TaxID=948106 RepID=UPI0004801088|nr:hypothetical protein [Paraburkholderia dilworthii]
MNHTTNHRTFNETYDSYRKALTPTSQQVAGLCASFAQMMADDSRDKVSVGLSAAGIAVVREPRK